MSKLIPLYTKRFTAIAAYAVVDDEHYDHLNQWRWLYMRHLTTPGYAIRREASKTILMHRVITGAQSHARVDHIDGNTLNNQTANLRAATAQENGRNSRKPQRNKQSSPYKGVRRADTRDVRWQATITVTPGKATCLGTFLTEAEAARAYDEAARRYFGEFARTNF